MSGLMSRAAVLTTSRISNFAILMISPLLLVRILDVDAYGMYQEFMIYATLFVAICGFGVDSSLTYFLPRYQNLEREFVSQNSALILVFSAACLTLFILAKPLFLQIATYDFVYPLAAYVFCFVNLNWLEFYWIAKQRTDLILYYSVVRLSARAGVLIVVAYTTRNVESILWSLVGVELLRVLLVGSFLLQRNLLTIQMNRARIIEQVRFAGPVGLAGLMQHASRSIGKLYIGSILGPVALAYYAVASYLLPIVFVIRGSIADVIFPDMVRTREDPASTLRLWQRSNVFFCILLFPPFVLLLWYADFIVMTLFTETYRPAVPVFQIYALYLLRRCFTMDLLLRTKGKSGFMFTGTGLSIAINLVLMVLFYQWFGLVGPAIAFIFAEILLEIYNARLVKKEFGLTVAAMVDWQNVRRVAVGCLCGVPILLVGNYLPIPELVRVIIASTAFTAVCWVVAYRLGVSDIGRIASFTLSRVRR